MKNQKILFFSLPIIAILIVLLEITDRLPHQSIQEATDKPIQTETEVIGLPGKTPIIIARVEDQEGKTLLIVKDLTGGVEFPTLELPEGTRPFEQPIISDKNILSIFGGNDNTLRLYRISPGGSSASIQVETANYGTGMYWSDYLLVIPPEANLLQLISPDLKQFDVTFESEYLKDGTHSIFNVISGKNGKLIAFSQNPVQKEDRYYAPVWVIDPKTASIKEELLNFPPIEPSFSSRSASVDQKYIPSILAISQDLTKIVYSFDYIQDPKGKSLYTSYAVYSVLEDKDLVVIKDKYYLQKFDQYGDILYQDKYPTSGAGGVILNLDDLSPVFDVDRFVQRTAINRVRIRPYGVNWLIGTESEVLLVSSGGQLIAKYPLPADFTHQEYEIALPISFRS